LGRGLGRCRPERITKHYFSFIGHFGLKNLGITINVLKEKEKKYIQRNASLAQKLHFRLAYSATVVSILGSLFIGLTQQIIL
jgi:hypothetical protein